MTICLYSFVDPPWKRCRYVSWVILHHEYRIRLLVELSRHDQIWQDLSHRSTRTFRAWLWSHKQKLSEHKKISILDDGKNDLCLLLIWLILSIDVEWAFLIDKQALTRTICMWSGHFPTRSEDSTVLFISMSFRVETHKPSTKIQRKEGCLWMIQREMKKKEYRRLLNVLRVRISLERFRRAWKKPSVSVPSFLQCSFDDETKADVCEGSWKYFKRRFIIALFLFIDSKMQYTFLGLVVALTLLTLILSSPAPIQRNANPSCPPYSCIIDTSLCFCGVKLTPEDPCCAATCAPCGPDFTVKPWLNFNFSSLNFDGIDFSFLG